jgi:hypothetical protein
MHHKLLVLHVICFCDDVGNDWVVLGQESFVVDLLPFELLGQLRGRLINNLSK